MKVKFFITCVVMVAALVSCGGSPAKSNEQRNEYVPTRCPFCEGYGDCCVCNGTGKDSDQKRCDACHGTGICKLCMGRGAI